MQKQTIQFVRGLVLIPFLTTGSPLAMLQKTNIPTAQTAGKGFLTMLVSQTPGSASSDTEEVDALRKERAGKIDAYYAKRNMPLEGYGMKMVLEAEKNDLDWRLLPALAIRETTGGKFACHNNPFGWGSCKIKFEHWDEAIETVARSLGGNNPSTEKYYKGKTTEEKLAYYNSVIPAYTEEIFEFMDLIDQGK